MKPYQNIINISDRVSKEGKMIVSILNKYTKKDLSRMDILDIGCGNGFFEFALSPYVNRIYGIDPSLPMLTSARQNNKHYKYKNIRFYKGSVENIPFTKTFVSKKYDKTSPDFDKNIYNEKQKNLQHAREQIKLFSSTHKILYQKYNKKIFWTLLQILN